MNDWLGRPNPGSHEAHKRGCICPVLDNNHGKWAPWPPDGWWITANCPMHGATTGSPSEDPDDSSP